MTSGKLIELDISTNVFYVRLQFTDYNLGIRAYFYGFVADLLWQLLIFDVDLQTNRKETELAIRQKTQRRI